MKKITSKVLRVPIKEWYESRYGWKFEYPAFYDEYKEVPRPNYTKYEVGDVVVIKEDDEDEACIGVVVGVIDNVHEDLRTDARGMVCFDQIRHATKADLKKLPHTEYIEKYID